MRASGKWLCIVVCALCITGVVISPLAAPAQSFGPPYIWDAGGADDRWDTVANWNYASYPTSANSAVFPGNSGTPWTCEPVVGTSDPAYAGALALYESVTLTGTDHSLTATSLLIDASSAGDYLELVVDGSGTEFIAVP
jgi:hypothetical protein